MPFPEQTFGESSDYDDNVENHSKDFFTEQQYTTDHFNYTTDTEKINQTETLRQILSTNNL